MSKFTRTFPDAIVFPDGTIRLVSVDAKEWVYANTTLKQHCDQSTIPDKICPPPGLTDLMSQDGLVVKYDRQPVFHYRSKRKALPKAMCCENSADDHDRHRARFAGLATE